ncbi:DUF485 domain-containing protein [Streptomyces sp. NPDC020801]|uniref:DUF485 domain-containing protein n=1 Tax=unclassified Streptomyces TaxID=2593676 RepID=UPI0037B5CBAD
MTSLTPQWPAVPERAGAPDALPPSGQPDTRALAAVHDTSDFAELRHSHRRLVFTMTPAFFAFYVMYVLVCTYASDWAAQKVTGHINVALLLGLAQFASTFLIAWLYSRRARTRMDPLADRLKERADCGTLIALSARGSA